MIVKQKATGYYLTLRGGFRKGLTCTEANAKRNDPKVASLVTTVPRVLHLVCKQFNINPDKVELTRDNFF